MACRKTLVSVLVCTLVLVGPTARAFSTTTRDIAIAYDANASPVVVVAGAVSLSGSLVGGLILGGAASTALRGIDSLSVASASAELDLHDATLEISRGALQWRFSEGALALDIASPYAIGLGLPRAPLPTTDAGAGFLLAGGSIAGVGAWNGASVELVPLDAIITIRDVEGRPVPGWVARHVNAGVGTDGRTDGHEVVFTAEGPFDVRIGANIVAGASAGAADLSLRVEQAQVDRFSQTAALLERTVRSYSEEAPSFAGQQGPLAVLGRVSGILNGALIIVPGDGSTSAVALHGSHWGASTFELGSFNMMRGNSLAVAWRDGEMRIGGGPTVALGRDGFAVDEPLRIGFVPLLSILLWVVALGAGLYSLIRAPPFGAPSFRLRAASFVVYFGVLLIVLWLWDRSFESTFGTGVVASAREQGLSSATLPRIATLGLIELIPWGIAALMFALPVRIALGFALRYQGRGKSYKGIATAGGLASLAVLGPPHALWCFNLVWAEAGRVFAG